MNAPDRLEAIVLDEEAGEKKITFTRDPGLANAATFTLLKEDHTLGNIIRMELLRDTENMFAGYKVPHPLVNDLEIKLQTKNDNYNPTDSFAHSLRNLRAEVIETQSKFVNAVEAYKQRNQDAFGDLPNEGDH
eukprot:GSMAST32.ASY1.ANO1.297.1 assembled CDS